MKQFQKILVGIDLTLSGDAVTEGSRRAAVQAEWLAQKTGASLTFFHSTWADLYEQNELLRHGLSDEGSAALEELAGDYRKDDLPVELVLKDERAWLEMIRRCSEGENDLVIVARRNTGSGRLGSVSRKLLRDCPVPVWVVKVGSPLLHERILCATDLTNVGDRAVELGAKLAALYDCKLDVVHAWQLPFSAQMSRAFAEDEVAAEKRRIQAEAEAHIRDHFAGLGLEGLEPHLHVGQDAPSRAIQEGVEKLAPDLLVMGTVSRSGVAGLVVGNTAEKVLDKVECSLLTIKPEDFATPGH